MSIPSAAPPPIPGRPIDPPPKPVPARVQELADGDGATGTAVGVGYRAFQRFSHAKASLLAAGTTYYIFLALFSLVAFGYGLAFALGADRMAAYLTEAIGEAFPGLLGPDGLDPAQLAAVGRSSSVIGAIGLLYGGTGCVVAARRSVHQIYGAAKDPRNVVLVRLQALAWLAALGPLILLSFVVSTVAFTLTDTVLAWVGMDREGPRVLLQVASVVLTLAVDFLIVYLVLGHFGGIRPARRARVVGAAVGALLIEVLKVAMSLLVTLVIDKPQYGAFAAPIGVLFVLYLQTTAVYAMAALTAGIAERDVPLVPPVDVPDG
jgi:uncharacterized BrkB/YihY/UPF0761 family membrane protein